LQKIQMVGIWLRGDYRLPPNGTDLTLTHVLIGIAIAAAVIAVVWMLYRRWWPGLLFIGVSLLGWAYVTWRGSPWADGKALAIVSPAILLAAAAGGPALASVTRQRAAILLTALITVAVLASNAFAFHDASLAPRDRLAELEQVGDRTAGDGPTLYTEFEEFGKHFLRNGDPEGSSEGWQRRLEPLRDGDYPHFGFSYDLDRFQLGYVDYYRTIVLRRSPVESRPPANYRLVWSGKFYDVWQRTSSPRVLEHFPLGVFDRGAPAPCTDVRRLAAAARKAHASLAYSPAPKPLLIDPTKTAFPPGWFVDPTESFVLRPRGPGKIQDSVVVFRPGRYDVWIEGSFARGYTVYVDGKKVGDMKDQLSGRDEYGFVGSVSLEPGRRVVRLNRPGGSPRPGDGVLEMLGPPAEIYHALQQRAAARQPS
jgi:hypothetical protein